MNIKKILRSVFYQLKPIIPRRLQLLLRKKLIAKQRIKYGDVWPIDFASSKKPENWNGWPDGKDFAFILTHDVELRGGHDKCRELMKVESELGFVSSFNFVPERYVVDKSLRDELTANGFEVGVHGLNHDGKLFKSKNIFYDRAVKINQYLKDWNSVGFRAPAMHHNLEWISKLDIEYDLSTFDTDPFEPQADGVGTIFPFWVNGSDSKNGYVELPYTLVQDFTLLVLMKESNAIWKNKLDWIAENNGMSLLNVHPDYINFGNSKLNLEEFPIDIYKDFLQYVKNKYANKYWNVLPSEAARFAKSVLVKN